MRGPATVTRAPPLLPCGTLSCHSPLETLVRQHKVFSFSELRVEHLVQRDEWRAHSAAERPRAAQRMDSGGQPTDEELELQMAIALSLAEVRHLQVQQGRSDPSQIAQEHLTTNK